MALTDKQAAELWHSKYQTLERENHELKTVMYCLVRILELVYEHDMAAFRKKYSWLEEM